MEKIKLTTQLARPSYELLEIPTIWLIFNVKFSWTIYMKYNNLHTFYIFKLTSTYNIIIISYIYIFIWISYDLIAMSRLKNVIFSHKNSLKLTLNMRRNAKLYLLSWALCFMWTKNYSLHKKLKLWMKGPDWKDQKSSSKYNPFMFSLRIIYTLCLLDD